MVLPPNQAWSRSQLEGTSGEAEGDMFDELMGKAKAAGFIVNEIITDKDSSVNFIYSKHFLRAQ